MPPATSDNITKKVVIKDHVKDHTHVLPDNHECNQKYIASHRTIGFVNPDKPLMFASGRVNSQSKLPSHLKTSDFSPVSFTKTPQLFEISGIVFTCSSIYPLLEGEDLLTCQYTYSMLHPYTTHTTNIFKTKIDLVILPLPLYLYPISKWSRFYV